MQLSEAISRFVEDLPRQRGKRGRKSTKTVKTYTSALNRLLVDCGGDKDLREFTTRNVIDYARWLVDYEYSSSTMDVYLSAVTRFCRWLLREGMAGFTSTDLDILTDELTENWRTGVRAHLPRLPDESDVQAVLGVTRMGAGDLIALRNKTIVETLRSTGARISEVMGLKRHDLKDKRARVIGKGNRERVIFFDDTAWRAITVYLRERDAHGFMSNADEPLFCRHDDGAGNKILPLSTNAARNWLTHYCKKAGAEHITPHQFRHRFGTNVLRQTENLAVTQDLMGHENANTTRIYAKLLEEDLATAHERTQL